MSVKTIEEWNAAHPEGTPVKYYHAVGGRSWELTRTTSPAMKRQDGVPVIKVAIKKHPIPLVNVVVP